MDTLGNRLRIMRGTESQTAFAGRLGLKQAIYSHYETGRKNPSLDVLVLIARALGVTADYLLGLSDDPGQRRAPSISAGDNATVVVGSGNRVTGGAPMRGVPSRPSSTSSDNRKRGGKR